MSRHAPLRAAAARAIAVALGLLTALPLPAAAAEILRIQSLDEPGSVATTGLEGFAEAVRSASGGELDIRVVPPRRLAGPADTLDAMATGLIDGHYSSPAYFSSRDAGFALLGDTLALYPDVATRDRWAEEGGGLEIARRLYAAQGAHLLGFVHWPEEWLVMVRPASILADIAGRKIRGSSGPVGDLLERSGARVMHLGGRDTIAALNKGEIDGADWSTFQANQAAGLYPAGRFAVRARHSMPTTELSISTRRWEQLSSEHRRLLEREFAAFAGRQKAAFDRADAIARGSARRGGTTLLEFSPASQATMRRTALAVFDDWAERSDAAADIAGSHRKFMEKLGLVTETAPPPQKAPAPVGGGSG